MGLFKNYVSQTRKAGRIFGKDDGKRNEVLHC
jgi:hypothetical protein